MLITWDVTPIAFEIGSLTIRWYGLLFATGFLTGQFLLQKLAVKEGDDPTYVDPLLWYVILGTVIGARLGHCLFYEPQYYLSNPLEILYVWHGGLASHGAALGIFTAIYLFKRRYKMSGWKIIDRLVIGVAQASFLVRLGNLMNSEIIGKPTGGDWGFIFTSVDNLPRHPGQLYEAIAYLVIFFVLLKLWSIPRLRNARSFLFGAFHAMVFVFRFFVEFFKENQVPFEAGMPLDMGQLLSIPFAAMGFFLMWRSLRKNSGQKQKSQKS